MDYLNPIDFLNQKTIEFRRASKLNFDQVHIFDVSNDDPNFMTKEEALAALAQPRDSILRQQLETKFFEHLNQLIQLEKELHKKDDQVGFVIRETIDKGYVAQYEQNPETGEFSVRALLDNKEYYLSKSETWLKDVNSDNRVNLTTSLTEDMDGKGAQLLKLMKAEVAKLGFAKLKELELLNGESLRKELPIFSRKFQELMRGTELAAENPIEKSIKVERLVLRGDDSFVDFRLNDDFSLKSIDLFRKTPFLRSGSVIVISVSSD